MLIDQIKSAQLEARKTRDTVAAQLLTTLIGEATMVTDAEYAAAEKAAVAAETPEERDARRASGDGMVVPPIKVTVPITDEKVSATVTKFLKNAKQARDLYEQEFERVMGHGSRDGKTRLLSEEGRAFMEGIVPKMRQADREIEILTGFLPKQLTEDELREVIVKFKSVNPDANVGAVMGHLKAEYAGLYDGKKASEFARA